MKFEEKRSLLLFYNVRSSQNLLTEKLNIRLFAEKCNRRLRDNMFEKTLYQTNTKCYNIIYSSMQVLKYFVAFILVLKMSLADFQKFETFEKVLNIFWKLFSYHLIKTELD